MLGIKTFVLPPLLQVLAQFGSASLLDQLWSNGLVTLKETLLGLLLGSAAGIIGGVLLGESSIIRAAFYPYMVAFQSLPKKDLKFIAVGTGAPALDALVRHRVDTLITYDTLFAP